MKNLSLWVCIFCHYSFNQAAVFLTTTIVTKITKSSYFIAINLFQFSLLGAPPFLTLISMLVTRAYLRSVGQFFLNILLINNHRGRALKKDDLHRSAVFFLFFIRIPPGGESLWLD